ncbi:MAG: AMP-binding protein, partial [Streptomycetaceae bacterium]|nr:AMP-binding protein [Streptomycetaceae bacterium]
MSRHGSVGPEVARQVAPEVTPVGAVPLTAAQREVWLAEQSVPGGNPAYRIGEYLDIAGAVDAVVFEDAVRRLVGEVDAIRARIVDVGGAEPVQVVGDVPAECLVLVDVSAEADPAAAARAWVDADMARRLDLAEGPLFSYALLKLGPERYWWFHSYHHVAMDGFSFNRVVRRLAETYSALMAGAEPSDSPFGRLGELVAADQAYRTSAGCAADRAHWAELLADRPRARLVSAVAEPRQPDASRRTARRTGFLELADGTQLADKAARLGVSHSRLVAAAVAVYAHRLTGARDVLLGLAVTGRVGAAARRVPGMMSNVLPLRLAVRPETTLGELVAQIDARVHAAVRHQRFRGEELLREMGLAGAAEAVFSPVVNFMGFAQDVAFAGHPATAYNMSMGPITDLSVGVWDRHDGEAPAVVLHADPARYGDGDLADHQQRIVRLVDAVARAEVDCPVGAFAVLLPDEVPSVAAVETRAPGESATFPALFEAQVRATPDADALVAATTSAAARVTLTYADLDARANRLAHALVGRGAAPGRLVGVALPRGADLVVAILAVLKSGAAYVPLDPDYPAARLAALVADVRPLLTVTTGDHAFETPSLVLDDPETRAELAGHPDVAPQRSGLLPRQLAYVVHTSGSTGRPKGVAVTHAALANLVAGQSAAMFASAADRADVRALRVALTTSVSFDASWDQLAALAHGHALHVVDRDTWLDPAAAVAWIREERIDFVNAPPAWLRELLDRGAFDPAEGWCPAVAVVGGDRVPADLWGRLRGLPVTEVWNCYGPTECTVDAAAARVRAATPEIGRPVPGAHAYVLDTALRPMPVGVAGELYVAGA